MTNSQLFAGIQITKKAIDTYFISLIVSHKLE